MTHRKIRIYVDDRYLCSTTHASTLNDAMEMVRNANMIRLHGKRIIAVFADQDSHLDRPKGNQNG